MNEATSVLDGPLQVARGRSDTYQFLALLLLTHPSERLVRSAGDLLAMIGGEVNLERHTISAIQQEYYDRFFVPHSGRYVPPFESAVRGRGETGGRIKYGALMGSPAHQVMAAYQATGFDPWALEIYEPLKGVRVPDQIGFELAFMAWLADQEVQVLTDADAAPEQAEGWRRFQLQFLELHLAQWAGDLARLAAQAGPGFYADVLGAVAHWVREDLRDLEAGSWLRGNCRECQ